MANITKVNFDYIKKWEGKLSSDTRDPAAKNPCPTLTYQGKPLHTNTGVTWAAFHQHFPTAAESVFLSMPTQMWLAIYEQGYWNFVKASEIDSQGIAELLADWAWGSGVYASFGLQKCLKSMGYPCIVDGMIGKVTIGLLNKAIAEKGARTVFDNIYKARTTFLQSLAGWKTWGVGWTNRMKDFYQYGITVL